MSGSDLESAKTKRKHLQVKKFYFHVLFNRLFADSLRE
jgi:hypothetical protein